MQKAWNRPNREIYSLSTLDEHGVANMNICVYVTVISMKVKHYALGVDPHSKTFDNIQHNSQVLLQLLSKEDIQYVRTFGYSSGFTKQKLQGITTAQFESLQYLKSCLAITHLDCTIEKQIGDHILVTAKQLKTKNVNEGEPLRLNDLKEAGIVR